LYHIAFAGVVVSALCRYYLCELCCSYNVGKNLFCQIEQFDTYEIKFQGRAIEQNALHLPKPRKRLLFTINCLARLHLRLVINIQQYIDNNCQCK